MYYQLDLGWRCAPGCPVRAALFDPIANAKAALAAVDYKLDGDYALDDALDQDNTS